MLLFLEVEGWLLIPVLMALGFTSLSTGPVYLAIVQDHVPNNRAVGNGIYITSAFLTRSLVSFLVGLAGDQIGLRNAFFWSAILAFASIPAILSLPEKEIV
jgi:FSR family fosmidomycin resistance protein-like MFS transporter